MNDDEISASLFCLIKGLVGVFDEALIIGMPIIDGDPNARGDFERGLPFELD